MCSPHDTKTRSIPPSIPKQLRGAPDSQHQLTHHSEAQLGNAYDPFWFKTRTLRRQVSRCISAERFMSLTGASDALRTAQTQVLIQTIYASSTCPGQVEELAISSLSYPSIQDNQPASVAHNGGHYGGRKVAQRPSPPGRHHGSTTPKNNTPPRHLQTPLSAYIKD